MLRYQRLLFARSCVLHRFVEVSLWDGTIFKGRRRKQRIDITVLGDETLGHDPENLSPDLANGMDTPVTRFVKCLVRRWVDSVVLQLAFKM